MADVPLPTCSGERAIHDPQEGLTVHFLHPVPYSKKGKLNYINSNFNVKTELIIIRTGFVIQSAQETTAFSLFISRQTVL